MFFGPLWSSDFNVGFKDKGATNTMANIESTDFKNDRKLVVESITFLAISFATWE